MKSIHYHEYFIFLSKYFGIQTEILLQKSISYGLISEFDPIDVIISKLKSSLGYQRRLLEPLSVAFTKSSSFDTIVYLHAVIQYDKHFSLLVADTNNIFKLLYFKKDDEELKAFKRGDILKIDSCYFKDGKLLTNHVPKLIWFYEFDSVFTVKDFFLDNLPECIYDETYTKITNLVHIIGHFLIMNREDRSFYFIHSKNLQIRIIPFKKDEIDPSLSGKLVRLTYCELDYGPDSYQLKMTEFSEFTVHSSLIADLSPEQLKMLIRFEYPSFRMSLSELTEKTVACTKIKLVAVEQDETYWKIFGYDSSQAVCFIVFDDSFADYLQSCISDTTLLLIDGIYKRGSRYNIRERIENIQLIELEDEDEFAIPITNPSTLTEEKLVIIEILVTEILEKTFINRNNKAEKYEKIRGFTQDMQIAVHNYNKTMFQRLLVGKRYRLFFLRPKFFSGNLYFIMNNSSMFTLLN